MVRLGVLGLIAVAALLFGLVSAIGSLDFVLHSAQTTAHVVGNQAMIDTNGHITYGPIVSFRTRTGQTATSTGDIAGSTMRDTRYPVGETMSILYRTDQPSLVKRDGFTGLWFGPLVLIVVGTLFAALAGFFLWRWTRPGAAARAQ